MKFYLLLYREGILIIYTVVKIDSGSGFNVFCGTIKNRQRKLLSRKILRFTNLISCFCETLEATGDINSLAREIVGKESLDYKLIFE